MKNILTLLLCLMILKSPAQHSPYVRLYNAQNQKFQKGYLLKTSDSGLALIKKGVETGEIKYSAIYKIRMKRSAGLTALIVGGIPVAAGTVLMARNSGWDGLAGLVLFMQGLIAGPVAGGIKAVINPKPLIINRNYQNWLHYKRLLDQKLD